MPERISPDSEFNSETQEEINLAEAVDLTSYGEEFWIEKINEGEGVIIGSRVGGEKLQVIADYSSFLNLDRDPSLTPEGLEERYEKNKTKIEKHLSNESDEVRRLVVACWIAVHKCLEELGEPVQEQVHGHTKEKFNFFDSNGKTQTQKGVDYLSLNLSELKGLAACGEYAIIAKEVLRRMGIDSAMVIGGTDSVDEDVDPNLSMHTYLVISKHNLVFDAVQSTHSENLWPVILRPEDIMSPETLMGKGREDAFGKQLLCFDITTRQQAYYGSGAH